MKQKLKIGMAVIVGCMCLSNLVFSQTNVTFQVDMGVQIGLGNFDPAAQGVSAVGSHNGWGGADLAANALTDDDGDSVYVGTQSIAPGDFAYKFVVTQDGSIAAWESSPDRAFTVTANDTTYEVTEWAQGILFKVDMTPPLAGGATYDSTTQYVAVVGSFNGWGGAPRAGSEVFDPDDDNVFEGRYSVGGSDAAYKFTIRNKADDAVATWESHPDRTLTGVGLDPAETPVIPWDGDPGVLVPANVTFKVDLQVMENVGIFDPTTQSVSVAGSFNAWVGTALTPKIENGDPDSLEAYKLTDDDADKIYTGTFNVGARSEIAYKFTVVENGKVAAWEDNRGGDRTLSLAGVDVELDTVEWNDGATFRVDMTVPIGGGASFGKVLATFDPGTQFVSVAGTFNDWGGTAIGIANGDSATLKAYELTEGDDVNIYEGTHPISPPVVKYKHVIVNKSDGKIADWETHGDRELVGLGTGFDLARPILPVIPWDGDPGAAVTGTVLFQVDISPLRELGLFDEAEGDTLEVKGGFNGWSDADPEISIMRQSFLDPAIYELPVTLELAPPSEQEYKFFIKYNANRPIWGGEEPISGWEEPGSTGGGNRIFTFTGAAQQELPVQTFNDIFNVIPADTTVGLHFTADMRCFLGTTDKEVDAATDTLRLDIQDAVWHFFNGTLEWHDSINNPGPTPFDFEDADGDSIYHLWLTVTGPIQNWVQYHLNWAGFDEASAAGFGFGRRNTRYVRPDENGNYAADYIMGIDFFNEDSEKPLTVEDPDGEPIDDVAPCVLTSVEQIASTIPDDYFLGQNYPNPFNPSTTIEYRIKKAGPVTLSLYNMLGQKLVDLVDEIQEPGSYKLTVDLSDLGTSGIYLYMINAPGFKTSRMMTLIK